MTRFNIRSRLARRLVSLAQLVAPVTTSLEPETTQIEREHQVLDAMIEAEEQAENKPAPMVSEPKPKPEPEPLTEEQILEARMDRFMEKACALLDHDNNFIDLDGPFRLWSLIIKVGGEDQRLRDILISEHKMLIKMSQDGLKAFLGNCPAWIRKKIEITERNLVAQQKRGRKGAFEIVRLVQEHVVNTTDPACQLAFTSRPECMKALGWAEGQLVEKHHVAFSAFIDRGACNSYNQGLEASIHPSTSRPNKKAPQSGGKMLMEIIRHVYDEMSFNFYGDPNPGDDPVREQKKQRYLQRVSAQERALNALQIFGSKIRNSRHNAQGQLENLIDNNEDFLKLLKSIDEAVSGEKPLRKPKRKPETIEFKALPTPKEEAALKKARREAQEKAKQAKLNKKIETKLKKIHNAIKSNSGLEMAQKRYKQLRNDYEQFPLEWDAFKAAYEQQLAEERKKAAAAAQAAARRNRKDRSAS